MDDMTDAIKMKVERAARDGHGTSGEPLSLPCSCL